MRLKKGVSILGFKPELNLGLMIAKEVYLDHSQELVITSGTEGKHKRNSRHYIGLAADLRTRYFKNGETDKVVLDLRKALGDEFYIKKEADHIHMQYNGR